MAQMRPFKTKRTDHRKAFSLLSLDHPRSWHFESKDMFSKMALERYVIGAELLCIVIVTCAIKQNAKHEVMYCIVMYNIM